MSQPPGAFYTEERWQNWIERIDDEEIDPEDEDSARLLLNLQDDAAIAVAKIIAAYDDDELDEAMALKELGDVREVVLADPGIDDEEALFLIDGVQTSLVCVLYAAEGYLREGTDAAESDLETCIEAAIEAERQEEMDEALDYCGQAGIHVIDGESLDGIRGEELEYGLVAEWVNGLDSLESALGDPEVIEPEEDSAT